MPAPRAEPTPRYDRGFMLGEAKRNQILELWEVQKYGADSYGDPDYVCIYGMRPTEWHARGVRLLARTALEAVRDRLGDLIGHDVARLLAPMPPETVYTAIDPFAGSCNALYWLLRHLPGATGLAFEADPTIFALTQRNLGLLDHEITLVHDDYRQQLPRHAFDPERFLIVFVAPPWGDALHPDNGLDLRRTYPPTADIVALVDSTFPRNRLLYVTQTHERIVAQSLAEYRRLFTWSDLRIYDINEEGMKHGVILGSSRWQPRP